MSSFTHVTVIKKANVYFNGNDGSRSIEFADGSKKTLGFMLPGEYTLNTADAELMEISEGKLEVLLPGEEQWQAVSGGETFKVQAKAKFNVKVGAPTDYCCSFLA